MLQRINCITSFITKQQNLNINKTWLFRIANLSNVSVLPAQQLSPEQEVQILKMVNENTVVELNRHGIKKVVVKKLVLQREKNGVFKTLGELKEVEGMDDTAFQKFCVSVLGKKKRNVVKSKSGLLITPPVADKQKVMAFVPCAEIVLHTHTTLGLHFGPDAVSWALLNHTYNLLEWNYDALPDTLNNMNIINLIGIAFEIGRKIPASDLYVFHEHVTDTRSRSSAPMITGESQLIMALVSYLAFRSGKSPHLLTTDNLFTINYKMLVRSFGLLIGNEIVSTQPVVGKLFGNANYSDESETNFPRISVGDYIINEYDNKQAQFKEQMNWALLNAVAFVHRGIHNKPM